MDRKMIEVREAELKAIIADANAELHDLAAAKRVLDRHEGKEVKSQVRDCDFLSRFDSFAKKVTDNEIEGLWAKLLSQNIAIAGSSQQGSALLRLLANYNTDHIEPIDPVHSSLVQLYHAAVPQRKLTLPDMILGAMWSLAKGGRKAVSPKIVEETIQFLYSPEPMSQKVNSVMWRMVDRGELVKVEGSRLYALPETNKAADDASREGASARAGSMSLLSTRSIA